MGPSNANQCGRWLVSAVDETGSTNADLLGAGTEGAPDRTVLRADFQSSGRGRLDRTWEAPRGVNLLVSFLFRRVPPHPGDLTRAVALAALRVMSDQCGVTGSLKWPNDVLIDGVKAGGILAQAGSVDATGRPSFVVVGLGLNLGWAPEGATSLAAHGWTRAMAPHDFCLGMLPEIDAALDRSDAGLHEWYAANLGTLGSRVRVELPDGAVVTGRATAVERDGRLVVLDDCAVSHRFDTADVVHLRPDDA